MPGQEDCTVGRFRVLDELANQPPGLLEASTSVEYIATPIDGIEGFLCAVDELSAGVSGKVLDQQGSAFLGDFPVC